MVDVCQDGGHLATSSLVGKGSNLDTPLIGCCHHGFIFEMTIRSHEKSSPSAAIRCGAFWTCFGQEIVSSLRTEIEVLRNELFEKDGQVLGLGRIPWAREFHRIDLYEIPIPIFVACVYCGYNKYKY